jgi:quercetin dioxygenase-like cupin family protein
MPSRRVRPLWGLMFVGLGLAVAAALWRPAGAADAPAKPAQIKTEVVRWDDAQQRQADWGQMRTYFRGETGGTKNVLTAVAVVEPGKAVHKAHRHAEEEYLLVVEGSGTWSVGGKESPAQRGDILFAEPWVFHGLTNTGDRPLIFAVIRYAAKGWQPPPRPDDRPDEQ